MTSPKTLKDFNVYGETYVPEGKEDKDICWKDDLKSEAIKWVKEIEKEGEKELLNGTILFYDVESFIKHFFNLTEEDLK